MRLQTRPQASIMPLNDSPGVLSRKPVVFFDWSKPGEMALNPLDLGTCGQRQELVILL
jgi:hypothetical protein